MFSLHEKTFETTTLEDEAKSLKVLYVEEHAGTRLQLSRILKKYFHDVFVTMYADNALKIFENGYFDLIISTLALQDMEITEFCQKIKHIAPKKPIIIVSNKKDASTLVELINIGISGFISTPLDDREIIHILSRIVLELSDLKLLYSAQDDYKNVSKYKREKSPIEDQIQTHLIDNHGYNNLLHDDNIDFLLTKNDHLISAKEFIPSYPLDLVSLGDRLLAINEDLTIHINNFITHPSKTSSENVAREFKQFSELLYNISEFSNISFIVKKLSLIFESLDYTLSYVEHYDTVLSVTEELLT